MTETVKVVSKNKLKRAKILKARKFKEIYEGAVKEYAELAKRLPASFNKAPVTTPEVKEVKAPPLDNDDDDNNKRSKKGMPRFGNTERAETIFELKKKLETMKGKKLPDYEAKLKKRRLQTRLRKKERAEERAKLHKDNKGRTKGNPFKPAADIEIKGVKPEKPEKTESGEVLFNKFDFEEGAKPKKGTTDPKGILHKLAKREEKLKKLEQRGLTDKVKQIKEKMTWDAAIQKAEGVKVKDNVELLKKTVQKNQQLKNRSKKKWESRNKTVETKKDERQKKRTENIKTKKKEMKQKKIKKSAKKGRVVL